MEARRGSKATHRVGQLAVGAYGWLRRWWARRQGKYVSEAAEKEAWLGRGGHKKHQLGWRAERYAAQRLTAMGYRIRGRNVATAAGEIDLVAEHGDFVVFVEVRSRREDSPIRPSETLTAKKQRRMTRCGEAYLRSHRLLGRSYRFDVAEVTFGHNGRVKNFNVIEAISAPRRR